MQTQPMPATTPEPTAAEFNSVPLAVRFGRVFGFGAPDTNKDGSTHLYRGTIGGLPSVCEARRLNGDVLLTFAGERRVEQIISGRATYQTILYGEWVLVTSGRMYAQNGARLFRDDLFGFASECVLSGRGETTLEPPRPAEICATCDGTGILPQEYLPGGLCTCSYGSKRQDENGEVVD